MRNSPVHRAKMVYFLIAMLLPLTCVQAQSAAGDRERVGFDSPEGWAMAHTVAATLNLGALPATPMTPWQFAVSAELGSIPRLSKAEQRVGFGGFKFEDMNKSPVFGRARMHMGLPAEFTIELSWTPPIKLNGARPEGVFGLALERPLLNWQGWQLGGRLFALRGDAAGDISCSKDVVAEPPGSAGNPFGCRERSNDSTVLDHEGVELMLSRQLGNERWQVFLAMAHTRLHPQARVSARVFAIIDESTLVSSGDLSTATLGITFRPSPDWSFTSAFSYTPLDVRRPPLRESRNGDFWSLRLGVNWHAPRLPWRSPSAP